LKVQKLFFPQTSACAPDDQTGSDAESETKDLMAKKWGDKKIGNQRWHCLRAQHGRPLDFFVIPFFCHLPSAGLA
jgi:hypothetical protein